MRILVALLALVALAQSPYKDAGEFPQKYNGPGRDDPQPADLSEVRIGFFGPENVSHPVGGTIWQGAELAVKQANLTGGYKGLPFRLVSRWSDDPWRAGAAFLVRMAYQDNVWAIIGGIDGPSTHLAEQVVVKARLALVSPASTDPSVNLAGVPWVFSCVPGDDIHAAILARALTGQSGFTLISATDHDSRMFMAELKKALASRRLSPASHVEFDSGKDPGGAAERAKDAKTVVLVAGPLDSARFIAALRTQKFAGKIYSGHWIARLAALHEAESVLFPSPLEAVPDGFSDYAAIYAYDATNLVIAAIRKAGLNRVRIRDAIQEMSPYNGASGVIEFDGLGRNTGSVGLATVHEGRITTVKTR